MDIFPLRSSLGARLYRKAFQVLVILQVLIDRFPNHPRALLAVFRTPVPRKKRSALLCEMDLFHTALRMSAAWEMSLGLTSQHSPLQRF